MDYSELVAAINNNNKQKVNKLIRLIRPRLIAFLCIHMNADRADAKDVAQDAMLIMIESVNDDVIRDPEQIIKYMMSVCRNRYLKLAESKKSVELSEKADYQAQPPNQLQALLDKEQKELLRRCLQQLKEEYQRFMQFWFENPDAHTEKVAEKFGISKSNAWTRKHRLTKKLNECYQKKSKL
jgi:RNA polymerase sigma factor (sigma-70 family)